MADHPDTSTFRFVLAIDPDTIRTLVALFTKQDPTVLQRLDQIQSTVQEIKINMAALDDKIATLTQDVTDENTVIDSAITLIGGIPKLITDAVAAALAQGATPAQLQGLTDLTASIEAKKTALAAAVTANTPTPPAPPAVP